MNVLVHRSYFLTVEWRLENLNLSKAERQWVKTSFIRIRELIQRQWDFASRTKMFILHTQVCKEGATNLLFLAKIMLLTL